MNADITDALNSQDFYEMCQQYRHSFIGANEFEALKDWILANSVINNVPVAPT